MQIQDIASVCHLSLPWITARGNLANSACEAAFPADSCNTWCWSLDRVEGFTAGESPYGAWQSQVGMLYGERISSRCLAVSALNDSLQAAERSEGEHCRLELMLHPALPTSLYSKTAAAYK